MANLSQLCFRRTRRFETAIWAAKLVLLSGAVVSTILLFKMAMVPYMVNLNKFVLPCLRCWLSPPYIYIIFNVIILAMVACSTHKPQIPPNKVKPSSVPKLAFLVDNDALVTKSHQSHYTLQDIIEQDEDRVDSSASCFEDFVNPTLDSRHLPHSRREKEISEEEKLKPRDGSETALVNDTLEDAWKIIMEGQEKEPNKRQLQKSDTWETSPQVLFPKFTDDSLCSDEDDPVISAGRELRKSDTFSKSVSLRRENSMSPDELNKRAEAFIRKFTYEMRLQRHELPKEIADMNVNKF